MRGFGDRDEQWYELVGDWKESLRLKGKLIAVFERIRSRGMLGGLWVEIERMATGSELAKKHPERWLTRHGDHTIMVRPRGIAVDRQYRLIYDNTGRTVEVDGYSLVNDGVAVSVAGSLCSELLLLDTVE
jgi:hypothetical protein